MPSLSALLALLALSIPAGAVRPHVPAPDLCRLSEVVAIGEVTGADARWMAGPLGGLETVVDVSVERVLEGPPASDLVVVVPGGRLDGVRARVDDAAVLVPDQRYLLLLLPRGDGTWAVTGGPDGAIPLRTGPDGPGLTEAQALSTLGGCLAR